jgi:hypothetical protein
VGLGLWLAPAPSAGDAVGGAAQAWAGADAYVRVENEELRRVIVSGPMAAPYMAKILDRLLRDPPQGVVLHFHGCGYRPGEPDIGAQARFFASLGYVVLLPNSFKRDARPATCNPRTRATLKDADLEAAHRLRLEEIAFAVNQVSALPWARGRRLILAGYGEGADAVLAFAHKAVKARIAIDARCRHGIDLDPPAPTFVLTSRFNPPDAEPNRCREAASGDPFVEFYEPDGSLSNALLYRDAQTALGRFLARVDR